MLLLVADGRVLRDVERELVLPTEGRAARMTRSLRCSPVVSASRSLEPVRTPLISPLCCVQVIEPVVRGVEQAAAERSPPRPAAG